MNRNQRGLSLIELMVSMALGLIIVLGVTQAFISAKNTYLTQNAASAMQEDARYLLTRMSQEIRMAGMFGCLATITPPTTSPALFTAAQATPISWTVDNTNGNRLMLVTADVGSAGTVPTWTVLSDCVTTATASNGAAIAASGQQAFLLRQVFYSFRNNTIFTGAVGAQQPLISNVSAFDVMFGLAADATGAAVTSYVAAPTTAQMEMIRTLRLTIKMTDPNARTQDQTYSVVAALRNRLQ
ncbi:PilW family protein [Pseudomonas japonica]|uniref:PilW family protein n=1 Tax=Pseudomonas japonica TaxID=256466 RepID=UPI0015E3E2BE|nr:prepilin-type N-terminal cleavage/methylation domain-containing protein [Pseudomonas japonica]MBA1288231.1 prepilin-type N-terminal cleavage/methylation domain-containing protein [Pseudomonas japonica]